MTRYIDADVLMEKFQFRTACIGATAEIIRDCLNITRNIISNAPTADVEEVVHARWEKKLAPYLRIKFVCSACGGWKHDLAYEHDGMKYCPNCGAKMDLED